MVSVPGATAQLFRRRSRQIVAHGRKGKGRDTLSGPMSLNLPRQLPTACALVALVSVLPQEASAVARDTLLAVAERHYEADVLARGRDYRLVGYGLFILQTLVGLGVAWVLTRGPLDTWGEQARRAGAGRAWLGRLIVLGLLGLFLAGIRLPFSTARYLHAYAYDMRHDPWSAFIMDWLKGAALGWLQVVLVGMIVLGLFAKWPRAGWLWAGALIAVLAVGWVFLAPVAIDPLFNRFTPLEDPELEAQLMDLAEAGGVPVQGVLVADASRRTRAVNAYFTGIGKSRRIVLYDTLLERFPKDEVGVVVAHEIGHWSRNHIRQGLLLGLSATILGLALGFAILRRWVDGRWGGIHGTDDPALALPAYALLVTVMLVALVPANIVSRHMETESDRVALALTGNPEAVIRSQVRLGRENLADVVPPAWIELTLYTHPANARRIYMAEQAR
jgi:STE24 endopeptidase